MMCKVLVLMSLGMCVLAAGCQKKLTKEEVDLMKTMSEQNHQTMMAAMSTMEQPKHQSDYNISSGNLESSGCVVMDSSLGQVHTAILKVLKAEDISVSSEAADGVSGKVHAKLATNNTLLFQLAAVDADSSKVVITIFQGAPRVSKPQIEYLFEKVIAQLEKN